ncbi:MAG: hypothetical protein ABIR96_13185 [Bdellovibrionota bacterium]
MSDSPDRNLALQLGDFGPLVIQPGEISEHEIARARYILFPDQIPVEKFTAALEWAAVSESPVFCTAADLKRFEKEGFGAYRFNVLGGFRELGFERGALRFIPARRKHASGWRGLIEDLSDAWGWTRRESFHVVVKSRDKSVLYLATPFIEKGEWAMLCEDKPTKIYASAHFGRVYWTALAERFGATIEFVLSGEEKRSSTTAKIFGARGFPNTAASPIRQVAPKGDLSWQPIDTTESGS